eukprot:tig00021042_g17606.t1
MHGRREIAAVEEALTGAPAPLAFQLRGLPRENAGSNPCEVPDLEEAFKADTAFTRGYLAGQLECRRIPREAEMVVCVYCRRRPDAATDGDVNGEAAACDGRGLSAPVVGEGPDGEEAVLVAWATLQVFDRDGVLRDGFFKLNLWRQRPTIDYEFKDNCEYCNEREQTVHCNDCEVDRKLCDECDDKIHEEKGKKGHSVMRLPTARMRTLPRPTTSSTGSLPSARGAGAGQGAAAQAIRHWGSVVLRVDPPHHAPPQAASKSRPPVFFAHAPQVLADLDEKLAALDGLVDCDGEPASRYASSVTATPPKALNPYLRGDVRDAELPQASEADSLSVDLEARPLSSRPVPRASLELTGSRGRAQSEKSRELVDVLQRAGSIPAGRPSSSPRGSHSGSRGSLLARPGAPSPAHSDGDGGGGAESSPPSSSPGAGEAEEGKPPSRASSATSTLQGFAEYPGAAAAAADGLAATITTPADNEPPALLPAASPPAATSYGIRSGIHKVARKASDVVSALSY